MYFPPNNPACFPRYKELNDVLLHSTFVTSQMFAGEFVFYKTDVQQGTENQRLFVSVFPRAYAQSGCAAKWNIFSVCTYVSRALVLYSCVGRWHKYKLSSDSVYKRAGILCVWCACLYVCWHTFGYNECLQMLIYLWMLNILYQNIDIYKMIIMFPQNIVLVSRALKFSIEIKDDISSLCRHLTLQRKILFNIIIMLNIYLLATAGVSLTLLPSLCMHFQYYWQYN